MTAVTWEDPPRRRTIKNIDAGAVVLVRFWPSSQDSILVPDPDGVPPHVVYRANIAPQGTTAFQAFAENPIDGTIDVMPNVIGERPTTIIDGLLTIDNNQCDYDLDVGQAFLCPFPGEIQLIGGAFAPPRPDTEPVPAPYNTSVQVVMPQEVSLEYAGVVMLGDQLFRRRLHRETGLRPRLRPTMTYFNVGTTNSLLIPRGAVAVRVSAAANVTFNLGNPGGASISPPTAVLNMTLEPGVTMPLGALALGSFSAYSLDPSPTLPWISFDIEVA